MNQQLIVDALHILTFCWVVSRGLSPQWAWKPDYVDYPAAIVAGATWFVITIDGVFGLGEFVGVAQSDPLILVAAIIGVVVVYVIATYLSIGARKAISREVKEELQ